MKVVVNAELIKSLNKKKDAAQLNYFKKELIKVLEKNDEEIVCVVAGDGGSRGVGRRCLDFRDGRGQYSGFPIHER